MFDTYRRSCRGQENSDKLPACCVWGFEKASRGPSHPKPSKSLNGPTSYYYSPNGQNRKGNETKPFIKLPFSHPVISCVQRIQNKKPRADRVFFVPIDESIIPRRPWFMTKRAAFLNFFSKKQWTPLGPLLIKNKYTE